MPLTSETFAAAQKLKPAALQALLAAGYAPARRIAFALSGSDRVGRAVAELLVKRCLRLLPRWRDLSVAENWFYHHAVLTTRNAQSTTSDPNDDPLVKFGAAREPAYVAFVRAIRNLPPQQREAFILHFGERLNPRLLAVAMDCSTQAAATHLSAATESLRVVMGPQLAPLSEHLTRAYTALTAAQPDAAPIVRARVRGVRGRIWLKRLIVLLSLAAIVAAAAWWWLKWR